MPCSVTIERKFGETTIDAEPTRIVTVGLVELEALGAPVPDNVGTADAVNFEAVAAQDPDLIIAIYSGLPEVDYDRLSEIAPTIAQPGLSEEQVTVG